MGTGKVTVYVTIHIQGIDIIVRCIWFSICMYVYLYNALLDHDQRICVRSTSSEISAALRASYGGILHTYALWRRTDKKEHADV